MGERQVLTHAVWRPDKDGKISHKELALAYEEVEKHLLSFYEEQVSSAVNMDGAVSRSLSQSSFSFSVFVFVSCAAPRPHPPGTVQRVPQLHSVFVLLTFQPVFFFFSLCVGVTNE